MIRYIFIHVTYARAQHDDIPAATGDGDRARDASLPAAPTRPGGGPVERNECHRSNAICFLTVASDHLHRTGIEHRGTAHTRDTAASTARGRLAHSCALLSFTTGINIFAEFSPLCRVFSIGHSVNKSLLSFDFRTRQNSALGNDCVYRE